MRRYNHLWERIIAPDNLRLAFDKASKKARERHNKTALFREVSGNPEKYLSEIPSFMQDFHTSEYHNKFKFIPKLRVIYSLPFYPDRIAHHAIMNVLEPIWNGLMHYYSYSCRKGKGQHKASYKCREYVRKYAYVAQLDISQFYPNLDHELLKEYYRQKIKDKTLLPVLDEIVDSVDARKNNIRLYRQLINRGVAVEQATVGMNKLLKAEEIHHHRASGVAVGNLVSQWFGNIFLTDIDNMIHAPFVRFCDDILIFGNDKYALEEITGRVEERLREKKLAMSHTLIYPTHQGVDFCGYKAFSRFTLVRKSTAKRKIQEVRQLHTMTYQHAKGVLAAMNGLLKHANSYNLRQRLAYEAI